MSVASHLYLIALGSNVRTVRNGAPRGVLEAAMETLADKGLLFHAVSPIMQTNPIGPSDRQFANAAAVLETKHGPEELLALLKRTERGFGRKARGQRWSARVLDLDIILWEGGIWESDALIIPHREFRQREFVLQPARAIAGEWRDPITNLSIAQLYVRLTKPRPVTR